MRRGDYVAGFLAGLATGSPSVLVIKVPRQGSCGSCDLKSRSGIELHDVAVSVAWGVDRSWRNLCYRVAAYRPRERVAA